MFLFRKKLREVTVDISLLSICFGVFLTAKCLYYPAESTIFDHLLFVILFIGISYMRIAKAGFYLFYLSHLIIPFIPFVITRTDNTKIISIILLIICSTRSLILRIKKKSFDYSPAVLITATVVLTVFSSILTHEGMFIATGMLTAAMWIICACFFFCRQTNFLDTSLDILSEKAGQPLKTICIQNNKLLGFFLACSIIPIILCSIFIQGNILVPFEKSLFYISKYLFSGLLSGQSTPSEYIPKTNVSKDIETSDFALPQLNPPAFIENSVAVAASVLIIILVTTVVICIFRAVKRIFISEAQEGDIVYDLRAKESENLPFKKRIEKILRKRRNSRLTGTRQRYYKTIKRHIRMGTAIKPEHTSEDIKALIAAREDISRLTDEYRKIRY